MKTFLYILAISAITLVAGCKTQDPVAKAAEQIQETVLFENALEALHNKKFVLEADRILFKYGQSTYVNANTNFISVNENKATIQIAFNSPYAGPNGIGGITVEGSVSNTQMKTDKKGNIFYTMSVQGIGVSAKVSIQMIKGTNQCTARIYPNFNNNIITFTGCLYQESESNVFKGRAL